MRSRPSILFLPALLCAALLGCGEEPSQAEFKPSPKKSKTVEQHQGQGLPGFFNPRAGETWTYKVLRDVPPDTVLNDDDQLASTDLPGGGYRFTLERKRVCLGVQTPPESDIELTAFDLSEDGIPNGREFLDISADGMIARGWKPAGKLDLKLQLLTPGVLLASPQMSGGQVWKSMGTSPSQEFQFRVLERTTLDLPAGSYETVRLQMNSGTESRAVRRTLWFAENVGIVKEEILYFNERKITLRESAELISWTAPTEDEPIPETPEAPDEEEESSPEITSPEAAFSGLVDEDVPMVLLEEITWFDEEQADEAAEEESGDEEEAN